MADIGLVGPAVMGQNLVPNSNDHGYSVVVYNRTRQKTDAFLAGPAADRETISGAFTIEELVAQLDRPRRVMLMVKAGEAVDRFIEQLVPHLDTDDIVIDGGKSHFADSERRTGKLARKGIRFVGTGVSGGEDGARRGPSIMPGGNEAAWPHVRHILEDISAKTPSGQACCAWVGAGGAGHYVKMVHNEIEYGSVALMWREGCIIWCVFLENSKTAFGREPQLRNLLLDPYFTQIANTAEGALRRIEGTAVAHSVPVPTLAAAITFFDGYRSSRLPANLLRAQRDHFGAHTYERLDAPRGRFFHTNWPSTGGEVVSTTYKV